MKMFFQGWIILFQDVAKSLGNLWRKHCPICICKHAKEKK